MWSSREAWPASQYGMPTGPASPIEGYLSLCSPPAANRQYGWETSPSPFGAPATRDSGYGYGMPTGPTSQIEGYLSLCSPPAAKSRYGWETSPSPYGASATRDSGYGYGGFAQATPQQNSPSALDAEGELQRRREARSKLECFFRQQSEDMAHMTNRMTASLDDFARLARKAISCQREQNPSATAKPAEADTARTTVTSPVCPPSKVLVMDGVSPLVDPSAFPAEGELNSPSAPSAEGDVQNPSARPAEGELQSPSAFPAEGELNSPSAPSAEGEIQNPSACPAEGEQPSPSAFPAEGEKNASPPVALTGGTKTEDSTGVESIPKGGAPDPGGSPSEPPPGVTPMLLDPVADNGSPDPATPAEDPVLLDPVAEKGAEDSATPAEDKGDSTGVESIPKEGTRDPGGSSPKEDLRLSLPKEEEPPALPAGENDKVPLSARPADRAGLRHVLPKAQPEIPPALPAGENYRAPLSARPADRVGLRQVAEGIGSVGRRLSLRPELSTKGYAPWPFDPGGLSPGSSLGLRQYSR